MSSQPMIAAVIMTPPEISAMEWIYISAAVLILALMASFAVVRVFLPPKKDDDEKP